MKSLDYLLLDVFTSKQFGGNPLAVFPEGDGLPDELMQQIAQELNLSETTFIQPPREESSDCVVRIFTPRCEIPMAGHPTIGTAYAILKNQLLKPKRDCQLVFDLGVGPTPVDFVLSKDGPTGLFMHQPLPEFMATLDRGGMAAALSLNVDDLEPELPVQVVSCGVPLILVPLRSLDAVRRAKLGMDQLEKVAGGVEPREVFVFSREAEHPDYSVHCRMFAPRFGIIEDPATGAAHGPLGGYLVRYGLSDGKRILSEQGFEMGRPSSLEVRVAQDAEGISGVLVGGDCIEVGRGNLLVPEV